MNLESELKEYQINIKNLTTNYKVIGKGTPILILHGWPSSSEKWVRVGELLSEKGIMVVIPDLPGFGKSQIPNEPWDLDKYVNWLNDFSESFSEFKNGFYLLGHSFGGAVSAKFSLKYAQKIKKLFLVSAALVRKKTLKKKIMFYFAKLFGIFSFLPYYHDFRKFIYKFIIRKSDYAGLSGIMKETYLNGISEDLSYTLNFLRVPTIILWGDKDNLTSLEQAYFINKKIDDSKLEIIEGGDHSLQINFPEKLSEKIINNL